ncbi:alcohol dehydrogenase catalytic domain-containing protein [Candidatus Poribacteria bacterium]|nr:alcohol dehydrogenase catalytic domain-containing protein [Candidatus Poribacteria bacterium]
MRVAMYYNNNDIRIEEQPKPSIGPGEVLMRIEASGICGSDVMEWYRIKKAPLVLGHEVAGEIVEVGQGVTRYKVGDRIAASHHVPCNTCHYCLSGRHTVCDTLRATNFDPGGFAEYVRLPAINVDRGVYPLPDDMPYDGATFIEPLACVLRAQRITRLQPGQSVLVVGSGMTGLLHANLAKASGAGCVMATDISGYRLEAALQFGADLSIDASEDVPKMVRKFNDGKLADIVIVCTGAVSAVSQALQSVDRGGTVLFFAPTSPELKIPVDVNELFFRNGVTLTSSYAGSPADHMTALQIIRSHSVKVREMITHRLSLEETGLGFKLVADAKKSMKVIIEPQRIGGKRGKG